MYVSPERWRCGLGTALWQHSHGALQRERYTEVTLWVLEPNHLARRFYENVGFSLETEIHKAIEYGTETIRAVRYRLALTTKTT
jgi:ribosomal protein S18 acetylase RimI-like enzyme